MIAIKKQSKSMNLIRVEDKWQKLNFQIGHSYPLNEGRQLNQFRNIIYYIKLTDEYKYRADFSTLLQDGYLLSIISNVAIEEEQVEDENDNETLTSIEQECLVEISELRKMVEQMRIKYMKQLPLGLNNNINNKIQEKTKKQKANVNKKKTKQKSLQQQQQQQITSYHSDHARQQYGLIKHN